MVDSIDEMLDHRISRKDLGQFEDNLLTNLKLVKDAKRVYFDQDCLAVEKTDGTYLTAEEAMRLYQEHRELSRCHGGSSSRVAYDGVVGRVMGPSEAP